MDGSSLRLPIEALHTRLRTHIAALGPAPLVGDVTRVVLEVSSLARGDGLWSLEFLFDEDDSRVALLEARFGDGVLAAATGAELRGYVVRLLLPKLLPKNTFDGSTASEHLRAMSSDRASLVARFVRALDELGAYRFIEQLRTESVETELR